MTLQWPQVKAIQMAPVIHALGMRANVDAQVTQQWGLYKFKFRSIGDDS